MIEKLTPITGTWNDDIAEVIKKINEIVDVLNDMSSERAKAKTREPKKRAAKDKVERGIDVDAFATAGGVG